MTKKIVLLGSTGSIGRQVLQVVDDKPEQFKITALAAGSNISLLIEQIKKYRPRYVSVALPENITRIKNEIKDENIEIFCGQEGLKYLAELPQTDVVLVAVSGINGLQPTLSALEKGTAVALANKETLVAGGSLVMDKAVKHNVPIIPVDSEHSAIFQCLEAENISVINKLILTASGGPFLRFSSAQMEKAAPAMALQHPKWQMGAKITVDSAGLINKGLEVIEAHWLFEVPYEQIDVIVHPQSIIHSMVEYADGSVLAQMGMPDMRVPIQYALTYPNRLPSSLPKLNLTEIGNLSFERPNYNKFPGLMLAFEAGKLGGTMPAVYNAANEAAVELYLHEEISFTKIPVLIEYVMNKHQKIAKFSIEEILAIDKWARQAVYDNFNRI